MKKKELAKKLIRKKAVNPLPEMIPVIEQWFTSDMGKALLKQQQSQLDEILPTLFGYHLMQMSVCRENTLCNSSAIRHQFSLGPLAGKSIVGVTDEEQLPIETESVDVAMLHHVMEYTQHPHQLLREVSRVVMPSGHIVIVGFNPVSFIGLHSIFGRVKRSGIWQNHLLSVQRLADWLTLMDFQVQSVQYGFYKPLINLPFGNKLFSRYDQLMTRFQLPLGGFYVMVAKKEVSRLTPIKPRWRSQRSKSFIPIMEPSMYSSDYKKKQHTIH